MNVNSTTYRSIAFLVCSLFLLAGCGGRHDASPGGMSMMLGSAKGEVAAGSSAPMAVGDVAASVAGSQGQQGDTSSAVEYRAGQLTAGEWNDLEHWDFWSRLMGNQEWSGMRAHWGLDPSGRVTAIVVDASRPVTDARVILRDGAGTIVWEARTDNSGRAELFAGLARKAQGPFTVESEGRSVPVAGTQNEGATATTVRIDIPANPPPDPTLDVMFVIDATGSMGDEMEYIKTELHDVVERVRAEHEGRLQIRLSSNFYRDEGDDYVVRSFPFTTNVDETVAQIARQRADGGGDFEEAVEEGLEDAIMKHEWSASATSRLLFLVLDAPPHHTKANIVKLQRLAAEASKRGIRIIPVASSGIDKPTEFLLRLLSISTGGTYTFLTDDSGIGDSHIQPTVGPYRVEYLNDLMVRLIMKYSETHTAIAERGDDGAGLK